MSSQTLYAHDVVKIEVQTGVIKTTGESFVDLFIHHKDGIFTITNFSTSEQKSTGIPVTFTEKKYSDL
jgi:hypothetical protein